MLVQTDFKNSQAKVKLTLIVSIVRLIMRESHSRLPPFHQLTPIVVNLWSTKREPTQWTDTGGQMSESASHAPTPLMSCAITLCGALSTRTKLLLRWALFLYLCLVLCPIGYLVLGALRRRCRQYLVLRAELCSGSPFSAWTRHRFYLFFPFDIGNNLARGIAFQAALWILIVAVLRDLFFSRRFPSEKSCFVLRSSCVLLSSVSSGRS
jgi:hypothetical protein